MGKAKNKRKPCIIITGLSKAEKQQYKDKIGALGGEYLQSDEFDPRCTHIICVKPSRTEKYLAGLATGKWLLTTNYLNDCVKKKQWLPEKQYEWSIKWRNKLQDEVCVQWLDTPCKWREQVGTSGVGAFASWWAAVVVADQNKKKVYETLLLHGGARIVNMKLPYVSSSCRSPDARKATHVFADMESKASVLPLEKMGFVCVDVSYIGAFLLYDPPPPEEDYPIGLEATPGQLSQSATSTPPAANTASVPARGQRTSRLAAMRTEVMQTGSSSDPGQSSPIRPSSLSVIVKKEREDDTPLRTSARRKSFAVNQKNSPHFTIKKEPKQEYATEVTTPTQKHESPECKKSHFTSVRTTRSSGSFKPSFTLKPPQMENEQHLATQNATCSKTIDDSLEKSRYFTPKATFKPHVDNADCYFTPKATFTPQEDDDCYFTPTATCSKNYNAAIEAETSNKLSLEETINCPKSRTRRAICTRSSTPTDDVICTGIEKAASTRSKTKQLTPSSKLKQLGLDSFFKRSSPSTPTASPQPFRANAFYKAKKKKVPTATLR